MKRRAVSGLAVLVLSTWIFAPAAFSKPDYSKKEGKPCTHCHTKAGAKDLNDAGKCYKDNKLSLEKCK